MREVGRNPARLLAPLLALAAFVGYGAVEAGGFATAAGRTWLLLGGTAIVEAVPVLLVWAGFIGNWLKDLGFRKGPRGTPLAWVLALLLAAGYVAATAATNTAIRRHLLDVSLLKALGFVAALVAGVVEEAVFRRMLMDWLRSRGVPAAAQLAASAVAFGLGHAVWGLPTGHIGLALGAAIATTVLGAGLAAVYLAGGRSLAPCIASHALVDAVLEPWLLFAAVGGA